MARRRMATDAAGLWISKTPNPITANPDILLRVGQGYAWQQTLPGTAFWYNRVSAGSSAGMAAMANPTGSRNQTGAHGRPGLVTIAKS